MVGGEAALGLWLLSGRRPVAAARGAICCFLLFAAVSFVKAIHGDTDCGCFGRLTIAPAYTFILDVAVAMLLATGLAFRPGKAIQRWLWFAGTAGALAAVGLLHSQPRAATGGIEEWIGRPLPNSSGVRSLFHSAEGRWAVLFYSSDCGTCKSVVPDCEALAGKWQKQRCGRVAMVETADCPPERQLASGLSPAVYERLEAGASWLGTTPSLILIENGRVRKVRQGIVECQRELDALWKM